MLLIIAGCLLAVWLVGIPFVLVFAKQHRQVGYGTPKEPWLSRKKLFLAVIWPITFIGPEIEFRRSRRKWC